MSASVRSAPEDAGPVVGVGIVGMGSIGVLHARALRDLAPRARLVAYSGGAVLDDDVTPAGPAAHVAPDEVVRHEGVDVVAICTPSGSHARLALAALAAGRHVVVEKPLAVTVEDALRVEREARERGLVVSMVSQRRFEPPHQALRRALDDGALGELRLVATHVPWYRDDDYYAAARWRSSTAEGGGSLMNQGVHNVDLLRWLCGPVESVTAQAGTLARGGVLGEAPGDLAEDTTVATLRLASGALGVVTTTTATPPGFPATLALHGSRGSVELAQDEVLRWDVPGVPAPTSGSSAGGAADPLAIGHAGHRVQWERVLAALDGTAPPPVDAADAVETVRLLCAIREAAATGRVVRPADLAGPRVPTPVR
ncbi:MULTISPECIES: Gfo/Idh/MocA family protein [Cellulosimicrobium]|uniref:Gfo/Idh/MocA family oxidoreductase n=1 Tax=Cellulosimicrobium sp. ES-005 TaxID=3163031 RepID=A0AAU8FYV3_9MICO|nr:Gfo/Idh/MocA family oxidoreductase [Cellulosimicrobium cellulans]MCO7275106.1 Gfo/Idh/MocA family oxidoreductase [Cellulosimicrobium cellulans]